MIIKVYGLYILKFIFFINLFPNAHISTESRKIIYGERRVGGQYVLLETVAYDFVQINNSCD